MGALKQEPSPARSEASAGSLERMVSSLYHDSDGSVYCYDAEGKDVPYPATWPATIGDVSTFARTRGIRFYGC